MSKKKASVIYTLLTIVVVLGIIGWNMYKSGFDIEKSTYIYIDNDDNADSLKAKLISKAKPSSEVALSMFSSMMKMDEKIHTGKYEVTPDITILNFLRKVRNHDQTPVKLVVPSAVRTMPDMAGRIAANDIMLDSASIASYLTDENKINDLGFTKETIYALFVPNTYEVYWDMGLDDLMKRLKKENDNFWDGERTAKLKEVSEYAGIEMTKEKVVTLASIVDSETANNGEKPAIAALYMNRLRTGMLLQSDPTVKFALQEFGLRRILNKHLEVDSPYNTYKYKGLMPGPICVPSIAGIDAVLNHDKNDYIYMCAKEDFSGTHNFAVTYSEHIANARLYTQALDARGIK